MNPIGNSLEAGSSSLLSNPPESTATAELASSVFEDIQKQGSEISCSPRLKKRKIEQKIVSESKESSSNPKAEALSKGTIVYPEGSQYKYYEGFLLNGQPEGYGKIVFVNGNTFEGVFKNGNWGTSGDGTFTVGEKALVTKGKWENQKLNGIAKVFFQNGGVLEIFYRKGIPLNPVTIFYPDDNPCLTYKGSIRNLQPDGFGKFTNRQNISYEGTWSLFKNENGQFEYRSNGLTTFSYPEGYSVEGCFTEGKLFQGKIVHSKSFVYEGYKKNLIGIRLLKPTGWSGSSVFEESAVIGLPKDFTESLEVTAIIKENIRLKKLPDGSVTPLPPLGTNLPYYFIKKKPFEGTIIYPENSMCTKYTGTIEGGIPWGRGEMVYSNGLRIEGLFRDGMPFNGEEERIIRSKNGKVNQITFNAPE